MENNEYYEEEEVLFKFKSEDGTITSIPKTGIVNCIQLEQENRTDWLFTKLPKELALKYSTGKVMTKYGEAKGDRCVIVTKYRGDGIDVNNPYKSGECYTLIFTPYYAEKNVDLEFIDEGISDADIKNAMLALDDSIGLMYKNKYAVVKEMREKEKEYYENKDYDYRKSVTRAATNVIDSIDVGENDVRSSIAFYDMGNIMKWIKQNPFYAFLVFGGAGFFLWTFFMGGG